MPVYLKPGILRVKDSNGRYIGVNIFAERPAEEVIADLEEAAEEAAEVIESIPSDYSTLAGRVDDLEDAIEGYEAVFN